MPPREPLETQTAEDMSFPHTGLHTYVHLRLLYVLGEGVRETRTFPKELAACGVPGIHLPPTDRRTKAGAWQARCFGNLSFPVAVTVSDKTALEREGPGGAWGGGH